MARGSPLSGSMVHHAFLIEAHNAATKWTCYEIRQRQAVLLSRATQTLPFVSMIGGRKLRKPQLKRSELGLGEAKSFGRQLYRAYQSRSFPDHPRGYCSSWIKPGLETKRFVVSAACSESRCEGRGLLSSP